MNWYNKFKKARCDKCSGCDVFLKFDCYTDYLEKQLDKYRKEHKEYKAMVQDYISLWHTD